MLILAFLVGCVVGFLVCVIMAIDMLERNGLYAKDGKIVDLPREERGG